MILQDSKLATLSIVASELEAQLLVNVLNESGIAAFATGGFISAFRAEAPGEVRILVNEDQVTIARSVLAARHQAAVDDLPKEVPESANDDSRLTRFAIWTQLVLEVVGLLGSFLFWTAGESSTALLFLSFAFNIWILWIIVQRLQSK